MSGKTKRMIYQFVDLVLWLAAIGGVLLMLRFGIPQESLGTSEFVVCGALVLAVFLRIPVLIHETGHCLLGTIAGFRLHALSLGLIRISGDGVRFNGYSSVAGATEMYPSGGKNMRARLAVYTLGGGLFNLLIGGVLLALYLTLSYHPALLFCGMLSLFSLYEGLRALLPAELRTGKTDGAVLLGLCKRAAEEEIMLRVLTAQGILCRGRFSDIPKELLFEAPVVREDLPAFRSLEFLKMQYLLYLGEEDSAKQLLIRLENLGDYLSNEERGELMRYRGYFKGNFEAKKEPLFGICELEEKLYSRIVKSAVRTTE